MGDFSPLLTAAEQKYGLPPGILHATARVESSNNPSAVSNQGAVGLMQILPSTAAKLGVNPRDPAQAIDGAARLWKENLSATNGDIDQAAMRYHGGTDQRNWGPKTHAYPGKLAAALPANLQQASASAPQNSGDPFENALSDGDASDPFEAALAGGKKPHAPVAVAPDSTGGDHQSPSGGGNSPVPAGNGGDGRNQSANPGGNGASPAGGQTPGLQPYSVGDLAKDSVKRSLIDVAGGPGLLGVANLMVGTPGRLDAFLTGATADLVHPVTAGLNTVLPIDKLNNPNVKSIWDGSSLSDAYHNNLNIERGNIDTARTADPTGTTLADIGGAVASPLNKFMAPVEGAGLVRNGLRLAAGGAAYGGIRGGSETGTPGGAVEGAALGAVAAPAGAAVGSIVGKGAAALVRPLQTLRGLWSPSAKATIAEMIDRGASADDIVKAFPDAAQGKTLESINAAIQYRASGGRETIRFSDPATPPQAQPSVPPTAKAKALASGLGTQGSRRGVEAVTEMPQQVADDVARLKQAGVPDAEAQAEADIRYVGGQPTVATVTRNPAEQRAMFEGAKQATPEGQQLADTISANNQAVHQTVTNTVDHLGGVPAQGNAAEDAANALARASDSEKAKVTDLYSKADDEAAAAKQATDQQVAQLQSQADAKAGGEAITAARQKVDEAQQAYRAAKADPKGNPDKALKALAAARENLRSTTASPPKAPPVPSRSSPGYIDITPLRQALETPEMANPNTEGLRALVNGAKGYIDSISKGTNRVTAKEAENVRTYLNSAYDPMGGSVNHAIGSLKTTLDQAMDNVPEATQSYKAARAAHQKWAAQYDNPTGIARLIQRDAKGNFVNSDAWRAVEGNLLNQKSAKPFIQVVRQLKALGANDALNRLKAGIIQNAYEKATNGARDQLGNATVNGKLFQQELNKIGVDKLKALFEPQELAHLATIGRAARHLNEAVPGSVNGSNTASSLVHALQSKPDNSKAKAMARLLAHGAASVGSPMLGNAAVEIGGHGVEALGKRAASKAVAQGLREQSNPALARVLAKRSVQKIEEAQRRAALGRRLMKPAASGSVDAEHRNAL